MNQTSANARKYLQTITEDVNLIFLTRLVNEIKNGMYDIETVLYLNIVRISELLQYCLIGSG